MQWELIVALVIAIPVILFPAAYIWYINFGGIYAAIKQARERKAARRKAAAAEARTLPEEEEYQKALINALNKLPW